MDPQWSAPAEPDTVGVAVASFVLSLVSIVLVVLVFPALIAVVLGFVALRKIKRESPKKGRGLAIAGVIIGILVALGGIALDVGIGFAISRSSSYRDLEVGDCLKDPGSKVFRVSGQSCSGDHERQVFAIINDPAPPSAPFPGSTPIRTLADRECADRSARIASVPNRANLRVYFLVPSEASWDNDDNRRIICMVGNRDGSPLTGSLPGVNR